MKINKFGIKLDTNAISDGGDGVITFGRGLTITDDTEQWNGTKYDIKSMDVDGYDGMLTANHSQDIQEIIGKTFGLKKGRKKVTVEGIKFAIKENALAKYAYDMIKSGFLTDFSIETIGPWPNDEGVYENSSLVGLSAVVGGNNKSAKINAVALNSLEESKKMGLDTKLVEELYLNNKYSQPNQINNDLDMKFVTIKNTRDFPVMVKYKNASDEEVETTLQCGESCDVSEDQKEAVQNQVDDAEAPETDPTPDPEPTPEPTAEPAKAMEAMLSKVMEPINKKLNELEQTVFDNGVEEPKFKKATKAGKVADDLNGMDYRERHGKQINLAWEWLKDGNQESSNKLRDINQFHLEQLQEKGIVSNATTLADFGNFVISDELLTDIEGHRSNFSDILGKVDFRETLSLQFAWLKRSGDIDMEEVEMCDDDADGNLKPISEYTANINQANLHELAAVTPVCNAATRFLAADLLGDVAAGYRTDYDRKRAQLLIGRLQQSVDTSGQKIPYSGTSDTTTLQSWVDVWTEMQEEIMGGVFIFNQKTYGELVRRLIGAGISGPLSSIFTTGNQPTLLGESYVVVPNELMPALNTGSGIDTKSFVIEGTTVSIDQAVFYADLSTFTGRTSGGLNYDLSTEAAYEESGTVKSAFQRNELVLRGSFFRNGAIRDDDKVVSMHAVGVS